MIWSTGPFFCNRRRGDEIFLPERVKELGGTIYEMLHSVKLIVIGRIIQSGI
jgi:hypothetical protein